MAKEHLTQKRVDAAAWSGSTAFIRDAKTPGLILAVNKTSKTFKVQADLWRGRRLIKTVRHTLGPTTELTLALARQRAQHVLAQIKRGVDPNAPAEPATPPPSVADMTVGDLWRAYGDWMRVQGRAERTLHDHKYMLDKYLADWCDLPLGSLLKSTARERHERLTREHGPYPANRALRALRAGWNWALKLDDHGALPANPASGVHFNPERRSDAVILPEDLPDWWRRIGALPNPLRTAMHRLGLLSGLRPGTLVSIERAWIDIPARSITVPRMKSGRRFALPLSGPMVALVEDALRIGDALHREPPFLFPTRSNDGHRVVAARVWRERTMPGETGKILRHTYRTMADSMGLPQSRARALLDHSQPGIEAHYLHSSALRAQLLDDQERMSAHILRVAEAR